MSRIIKALIAMAAIAAAVLVGGSSAQAAEERPTPVDVGTEALIVIDLYIGDYRVGQGQFQQYGDKLAVCDTRTDNRYVKAYLDIDQDGDYDRSATTKGHKAPYCSDWVTGNISEGNKMDFWVCTLYDGHWKNCSDTYVIEA